MVFLLSSSTETYKLNFGLRGHQDAILSMAISGSGNLLASGGIDGLRVWDLHRRVQAKKPNQMRNPRDPITCIQWLTRKDDVQETLCAATGLGYIILWRQRVDATAEFDEMWSRRIGNGEEIMSLTCETFEGIPRLITTTRDKRVQLWSLDSKYHLSNVFSVELAGTIPRASCFFGGDVVIFGMYDGDIHTLRSKDGVVIRTYSTGRLIGGAAVDPSHTYFVIDNGVTGFSLHRLDDGSCTRMYDTKPTKTFPKQVVFTEGGTKVVGGGEDGRAFVFHKATGALHQVLRHSYSGRVQTITAYEGTTYNLIATASSSNDNDPKINIWRKPVQLGKREANPLTTVVKTFIQIITHLLAFGMVVLIITQSFRVPTTAITGVQDLWGKYDDFKVDVDVEHVSSERKPRVASTVTDNLMRERRHKEVQEAKEAGLEVGFILVT